MVGICMPMVYLYTMWEAQAGSGVDSDMLSFLFVWSGAGWIGLTPYGKEGPDTRGQHKNASVITWTGFGKKKLGIWWNGL